MASSSGWSTPVFKEMEDGRFKLMDAIDRLEWVAKKSRPKFGMTPVFPLGEEEWAVLCSYCKEKGTDISPSAVEFLFEYTTSKGRKKWVLAVRARYCPENYFASSPEAKRKSAKRKHPHIRLLH